MEVRIPAMVHLVGVWETSISRISLDKIFDRIHDDYKKKEKQLKILV